MKEDSQKYDVIVIGGGASGMMAAGTAASLGKQVLLLEKNQELGKKLSITGGGRCNIFNAEEDKRTLLSFYDKKEFLYSPFSKHGMNDSWNFFNALGIEIMVEEDRKRAFPVSQKAIDVTAAMETYLTNNNVEVKLGVTVLGFKESDGRITSVDTSLGSFEAVSYVLSTGGFSHPETGSTGEGMDWLSGLGHSVHKPNPNLVPLLVDEKWVTVMSGTSLEPIKISFLPEDTTKTFALTGRILFTHFGLTGPLILNSAHQVKQLLVNSRLKACIDLLPNKTEHDIDQLLLNVIEDNKNKMYKNICRDFLPDGSASAYLAHVPVELQEKKVHSLTKEERRELAKIVKNLPLTITGTKDMDWSVISDGGVDLAEVDTKTMRSKICSNLYLTGDVLHVNRPTGGYSLQLCWTTGFVAGSNA